MLLFDGECGLCQASARFVLRHDSDRTMSVATLQSETGQLLLRRLGLPTDDFDSLVFLPDCAGADYHLRTDGVIAVLDRLPGGSRLLGRMLSRIPAGWRDAGYRLVARSRHRIFGEPSPEDWVRPEWSDRVFL